MTSESTKVTPPRIRKKGYAYLHISKEEEIDESLALIIRKKRKVLHVLPNVDWVVNIDIKVNVVSEDSTQVSVEEIVKADDFVNSADPKVIGDLADINYAHPVIVAIDLTRDSSKKATNPTSHHMFVPAPIPLAKHDLNASLPSIKVNVSMSKLKLEEKVVVINTTNEHAVIETPKESETVKLMKEVEAKLEELKGKVKAVNEDLKEEVKALEEELNDEVKALKDGMATLKKGFENYMIRFKANPNPSFFTNTPSSSK